MDSDLKTLSDQLSGGTLDTIDVAGPRVTLAIGGTRGALLLHCEEAELINAPAEYSDLAGRSRSARLVQWVGILSGDVLYIALAGGTNLLIRTRQVRLVCPALGSLPQSC